MAVVRWSNDFTLTSPLGTLTIPAAMLDPGQCGAGGAGANPRVQTEGVPGGDGSIFHSRFKNGYQLHLGLILVDSGAPLFDDDLQAFYDELMGHLDALWDSDGRISWPVAGGGEDRMLDAVRTLEVPGPSGAIPKQFVFGLETPFPYAMDAPQTTTDLFDGTPVTITRTGSSKISWPVAHVVASGADIHTFTLKNNTTGLQIEYDDSRPGAAAIADGHFAEIDFFRKTVTLDGDVTFLEEGVVWEGADFWPLVPGDQDVELDGADGELLYNEAWA